MDLKAYHRFDGGDVSESLHPSRQRDDFYVRDQLDHFGKNNALDLQEAVICVDSSLRDPVIYPSSAHFKVYLRTPLTNVVSCELISAEFPNVQYALTTATNMFFFSETVGGEDDVVGFMLPTGNYAGPDLAEATARLMNLTTAGSGGRTYAVTYNPLRSKFVFSIAEPAAGVTRFKLLFSRPGSCCKAFGFDAADTEWNLGYANEGVDPTDSAYTDSIASSNYADLFGDTYVYLSSPELDTKFHETTYTRSLTSNSAPFVGNAFVRLSLFGAAGDVIYYSAATATQVSTEFRPPLAKLDQLEFSWRRKDGTLVDFQGLDNSFTLRFKIRERSLGLPQFVSRV
jgi:hypothetical protein